MYTKIMVAVDGSPISMHALDEAIKLAKDQRAALHAVHVIEYPKIYVADVGYDPVSIMEPVVAEGRHTLQKAEILMKARLLTVSSELIDRGLGFDSIAEQLQAAANGCGADLIVLGTHGRGGFKRLLLGSVAEAFLRMSNHPMLLIPGKLYENSAGNEQPA